MILPGVVLATIVLGLCKLLKEMISATVDTIDSEISHSKAKKRSEALSASEKLRREREKLRDEDPHLRSSHNALIVRYFEPPLHGLEWSYMRKAGIDFVRGTKGGLTVVTEDVSSVEEARLFRQNYRPPTEALDESTP